MSNVQAREELQREIAALKPGKLAFEEWRFISLGVIGEIDNLNDIKKKVQNGVEQADTLRNAIHAVHQKSSTTSAKIDPVLSVSHTRGQQVFEYKVKINIAIRHCSLALTSIRACMEMHRVHANQLETVDIEFIIAFWTAYRQQMEILGHLLVGFHIDIGLMTHDIMGHDIMFEDSFGTTIDGILNRPT